MTERHYEVISPEMRYFPASHLEPPEDFRCWGVFLAANAKDAIRQAAAHETFREWVQEQRADGSPPFKGLTASLTVCEHGVCWGCDDECPACAVEDEEVHAAFDVRQEGREGGDE